MREVCPVVQGSADYLDTLGFPKSTASRQVSAVPPVGGHQTGLWPAHQDCQLSELASIQWGEDDGEAEDNKQGA